VTDVANVLQNVHGGPHAFNQADGTASVEQLGNDSVTFSQDVSVASGDAVAGSQVTGVVGDQNATIQVTNSAPDGPSATSGTTDDSNIAGGNVAPLAEFGPGGTGTASAQQTGDALIAADQTQSGQSGDAVGGAQVTGAVGS